MKLSGYAVKKALSLGASEAEAYVQRTRNVQFSFSDSITDVKIVNSTGLGLMVAVGKKTAIHATSIIGEEQVSETAERAVKIAKATPSDPDWHHINKGHGNTKVEGCFDKAIEDLNYDDIVDRINRVIASVTELDGRVKPTRGILALLTNSTSITNSYGEAAERRGTFVNAYLSVTAKEGDLTSIGTESTQSRSWGALDLEAMASKAVAKAVEFLRAKTFKGGEMPVIIRNQVFASILSTMLSPPVNAHHVQTGASPLADRLGEMIASEDIDVIDDGTLSGGFRTAPFDDEGHPTQRTPVIEGGVLKSFLHSSYTALKGGVDSTGNGWRPGYSSSPSPSASNFILKAGRASPEEIIEDTKEGVYVVNVIGEWLSNPVSGNMNATVTHGYIVEDGVLRQPIKGVVLAGNFYEMLKGGFEVIGGDTMNSGATYSPTVKIGRLTIAGE
ncbi:MAG TPA: TldD/PmbA family protein [Patescibacteria group bacterium]|nr:TldD/PmbA family protein [Patescibacteria group bacterium]